jgi:hypothetical protein
MRAGLSNIALREGEDSRRTPTSTLSRLNHTRKGAVSYLTTNYNDTITTRICLNLPTSKPQFERVTSYLSCATLPNRDQRWLVRCPNSRARELHTDYKASGVDTSDGGGKAASGDSGRLHVPKYHT